MLPRLRRTPSSTASSAAPTSAWTIDTAEIYGGYRVEEVIGAALAIDKGLRARLEIVTKAGIYVPNAFHSQSSRRAQRP